MVETPRLQAVEGSCNVVECNTTGRERIRRATSRCISCGSGKLARDHVHLLLLPPDAERQPDHAVAEGHELEDAEEVLGSSSAGTWVSGGEVREHYGRDDQAPESPAHAL